MKNALIISCFDWYEKRLEPLKKVLETEYDVTIVTSDFDHILKTYITEKKEDCDYLHVPRYKKNLSLFRVISHVVFGIRINKVLKEKKPDLIYALLPPNNVGIYCSDYKKNHPDCKLFVDIIDLWPESLVSEKSKIFVLLNKWKDYRQRIINISDEVIVECDYYKERLKLEKKASTLYLFKKQSKTQKNIIDFLNDNIVDEVDTEYRNHFLRIGFVGSINHIIDIDEIIRIVLQIKKTYKVEMHIIGKGEREEELLNALKCENIPTCFYGAVFDEEIKIKILGRCHYGLNIMKKNVSVGLSIKSIDYFSIGLPIINNIKGDTWKIIESNKFGINVGDDCEIVMPAVYDTLLLRKSIISFFDNNFSEDAFMCNCRKILIEKTK